MVRRIEGWVRHDEEEWNVAGRRMKERLASAWDSTRAAVWSQTRGKQRQMGTMPNSKCCPKSTAAAVGQAVVCLKRAPPAATPTASIVQKWAGHSIGLRAHSRRAVGPLKKEPF
eukprot:8889336-Pyramimonas_sp.AAC.1